jgi:hypothetical protein
MMERAAAAGVRGDERRWGPAAAVLAVLLVVVLGGHVLAGALSEPSGAPVTIAGVLRVSPLSGWQLARRFDHPQGAQLTRGDGNLTFLAIPGFSGTPGDLAQQYVDQILSPDSQQLSVSRQFEPLTLASGLTGVRIAYVGSFGGAHASIEGELTAVVSPSGVGAIFDGWAPSGLLRFVNDDMHAMIDDAEVR